MTRILIAGYQHETNTFAPSLADWAAFTRGDSFPPFMRGAEMQMKLTGVNVPVGGFIEAARERGWTLWPSAWAGAIPSSYVTADAFERIAAAICDDVRDALAHGGLDGIYLDLHGAAVAEHADDSEGELLARVRAIVGPALPLVASLDLHANVTERMLRMADALVAYRQYPHVDMADTGALAAQLLQRRLQLGRREAISARRLPFLIPLNAQSTWMQPAQGLYEQLRALDAELGTVSSFCMGFPASDFAECAPMVWSHGAAAREAVDRLYAAVAEPTQWRPDHRDAHEAVQQALALAEPLPESITAKAVLKVGDNITTDHIMPAGAKILPYRSNIPHLSQFCFGVCDESFPERIKAEGNGIIIGEMSLDYILKTLRTASGRRNLMV